jgi:hypothetical protein
MRQFTRRERLLRLLLIGPILVGVVLIGFGVTLIGDAGSDLLTARKLQAHGRTASAEKVEIGYEEVRRTRSGPSVDFIGVRVTYRAGDGLLVTAVLADVDADDADPELGQHRAAGWWTPSLPEYQLPMRVVYLPADPQVVMQAEHVEDVRRSGLDTLVALVVFVVVGVLLVLLGWFGRWRVELRSRT